MVVRGTGLSTNSGASYLWWLNGKNKGSQVPPTTTKTVTIDGQSQVVIAWDMTKSNLYENFTGDRPSVCQGQTIFGMTSSTGQTDIYDINFVESIDDYLTKNTAIFLSVNPGVSLLLFMEIFNVCSTFFHYFYKCRVKL